MTRAQHLHFITAYYCCSSVLVVSILFVIGFVHGQQFAPSMDEGKIWPPAFDPNLLGSPNGCSTEPLTGKYRTFNVGPGQTHTELSTVPWMSLEAGDVVNIFHRSTPYQNWIGYRAVANATHPVTINGVTDANCNRPVITGNGASPTNDAKNVTYARVVEGSAIVIIWKLPSDPKYHTPQYLSLRNLELSGARNGNSFIAYDGSTRFYNNFVGAIYAVRIHHLLVHNCLITNNGLGVYTSSSGQFQGDYSSHLTVRASKFIDNGYQNSYSEHNLYVQIRRLLVEGNYLGHANDGSSLKDRSSGTVIRYNYIHSSSRALDLIEAQENIPAVRADPLYPYAWVYGNIILNDANSAISSEYPIRWGFDNDSIYARSGTLYFYGNTYVYRTTSGSGLITNIFQMDNNGLTPSNPENFTITCWDNVFINQNTMDSQTELRLLTNAGKLILKGNNYLPLYWRHNSPAGTGITETTTSDSIHSKIIVGPATAIEGSTFMPNIGSPLIGAGNSFTPDYSLMESENSDFRKMNLERVGEYHLDESIDSPNAIAGARLKLNPQLNVGAY